MIESGWLISAMGTYRYDDGIMSIGYGSYEYDDKKEPFKRDFTREVKSFLEFVELRIREAGKGSIVSIPFSKRESPYYTKDRTIMWVNPNTEHTLLGPYGDFSDQTHTKRMAEGLPEALFIKVIEEVGRKLKSAGKLGVEDQLKLDVEVVKVKFDKTRVWTQKFYNEEDPRSYPAGHDRAYIHKGNTWGDTTKVTFTKTNRETDYQELPAYKFKLA